MESTAAPTALSPTVPHDPFVTVVNITSQSPPVTVPAPQAFYQNPQYHSVLEGRKLSVQVPNESSDTTEDGGTFVTVLDVRDGTEDDSPTSVPVSDLSTDPVIAKAAKLSDADHPVTVSSPAHTTELVTLYRLPGERLGLGLKFRGGESAHEPVQAVSVQSCAEGSPSARASCSWGRLQAGDRILAIVGRPVTALTRLQCVQLLQEAPLAVELKVRHAGRRETFVSQDSGISLGGESVSRASPAREIGGRETSPAERRERPARPADRLADRRRAADRHRRPGGAGGLAAGSSGVGRQLLQQPQQHVYHRGAQYQPPAATPAAGPCLSSQPVRAAGAGAEHGQCVRGRGRGGGRQPQPPATAGGVPGPARGHRGRWRR